MEKTFFKNTRLVKELDKFVFTLKEDKQAGNMEKFWAGLVKVLCFLMITATLALNTIELFVPFILPHAGWFLVGVLAFAALEMGLSRSLYAYYKQDGFDGKYTFGSLPTDDDIAGRPRCVAQPQDGTQANADAALISYVCRNIDKKSLEDIVAAVSETYPTASLVMQYNDHKPLIEARLRLSRSSLGRFKLRFQYGFKEMLAVGMTGESIKEIQEMLANLKIMDFQQTVRGLNDLDGKVKTINAINRLVDDLQIELEKLIQRPKP